MTTASSMLEITDFVELESVNTWLSVKSIRRGRLNAIKFINIIITEKIAAYNASDCFLGFIYFHFLDSTTLIDINRKNEMILKK